ncbi:uncharacterized protein LOC108151612 [Drosophila miranda]|uniref:uncharacterized protein LOC108151612 n=1 Tax=Drosophila miranda TaxID=7229 RepID=UPI0007E64F63|nr:uncharacterized protein LOC108151612 [Drosophila miranda]
MTTAACPIDLSSSSDSRKSKTANTRERETTLGESRSRLHRIGSLLTLAVLMYQLQQFAHPGSGGIAAAPTPSPSLNATYLAPPPDLLKRLRKRHNLGNFRQRFQRELNGSITRVDWENTCGGNWTGPEDWVRPAKRCKKRQLVIHALQNHTRSELRSLRAENKDTATTKAIDISQQRKWALHSGTYKFLPRLNASSPQLNLRHVHRDLQFYVGAFSYLRHAQLHWDYSNTQTESVMSAELGRLRKSARRVLCSVEVAINATNRLYASKGKKNSRRAVPLLHSKILSRELMEKRLQQFKTPLVQLHHEAALAARSLPAEQPIQSVQLAVDARFVKFEYVQYLNNAWKILARQRKQLCRNQRQRQGTAPRRRQPNQGRGRTQSN